MTEKFEDLSQEEIDAEAEAKVEPKEEEVRTQVIEKYGLDEDSQAELIENLTKDQLEQRKAFGKVVGQKIKYREAATAAKPAPDKSQKPDESEADVEARIRKEFEQRDLESMDLPDDVKSEVQRLATAQGISVREAAKDPYIQFKKEEAEKVEKIEGASPARTKKGTSVKFDANNPPQVDMSTTEGQKTWEEYTNWLKSQ